mgnify:CR=1 FL=1
MAQNITRDDSKRIVEKYATTAKNSCKILEAAKTAGKLDKKVSKQFVGSALGPLTNVIEKYRGMDIAESYGANGLNAGGMSKTDVKQKLA